jgi:glucose/arabinose dehydrogenase
MSIASFHKWIRERSLETSDERRDMHQVPITLVIMSVVLALGSTAVCQNVDERIEPSRGALDISAPFQAEILADLEEPWAMTFLPDGRILATENRGSLHVVTQDGQVSPAIDGVPPVEYGGQGGLGDVALHPDFFENQLIGLPHLGVRRPLDVFLNTV